jgi:Mrp family chromosome partitioning ATPase
MSSLDRAFFRAYAKEQPATPPEAAPPPASEGAAPFVYFQPPRKPQLRYRIEPGHAPWGAAAPHVDPAPLETPYDEGDYRLAAAADEAAEPAAWSHAGEAQLAPPSEWPTHVPAVAPASTLVPRVASADPYAEGIVCLPGMEVPESNYLAALVATQPVESEGDHVETPSVTQLSEPPAQLVEPLPAVAIAPPPDDIVSTEIGEQAVADSVNEPSAAAPLAGLANDAAADRTALLADENVAFWEVDRYLYPALSDRLLSRYEYFTHAGEKLKQAAQAGLKVLGITGIGRDEGRSTLAICLARAAARSGLKVALIDCDFQHPQLAQMIGLDVATGWESVALGETAVAEVAIRSLEDDILLLPLLDEAKTNALSLNDDRVTRILAQARQTHDVVILDAGPLDMTVATEPGASHASPLDAAIVVWDRRRRKLDEAQAVGQRLSAAGVEAVGIAENFAG